MFSYTEMRKFNHILFSAVAVAALAFASTSCNNNKPTNTSTKGIAKVYCDESFQNVMDQEVEVFEYSYREASILTRYMSESAALDSLLHKNVDLIVTSRDLTDKQREILKNQGRAYRSRKIAVDGVAIIVNKANDIDELSLDDLKDIFMGKVTKWGKVSPSKTLKNEDIKIVFDGNGSGILHYMKDKFAGGKDFPVQYYAQKSTDDVFKAVQSYKNAIGFIGVSWIAADLKSNEVPLSQKVKKLRSNSDDVTAIDFTDKIKVMPVRGDDQFKGVKPYQAYLNDGSYPLFRVIWAIDAAAGGTLDHGFYSFLTGVIGQKIILHTGVLPAAEPVRVVEAVK